MCKHFAPNLCDTFASLEAGDGQTDHQPPTGTKNEEIQSVDGDKTAPISSRHFAKIKYLLLETCPKILYFRV